MKKIKALILTTRDSKVFSQQFNNELPDPPQFKIAPGQNFSIGYPFEGITPMINQDDQLDSETEETAFENTPLELTDTDTKKYINKPSCIRHLGRRKIRFNNATKLRDSANINYAGKLSDDKFMAYTPDFLPVRRIF